jgi:hypothetical protein
MMSSLADGLAGDHGVPLDALIPVIRTYNAPGKDLLGLVIEDPISQEITDIFGDTEPIARSFF